jgi:hypothetical protein
MHHQSLDGAYFRGLLNPGFLLNPVEQRLDRLSGATGGFGKEFLSG